MSLHCVDKLAEVLESADDGTHRQAWATMVDRMTQGRRERLLVALARRSVAGRCCPKEALPFIALSLPFLALSLPFLALSLPFLPKADALCPRCCSAMHHRSMKYSSIGTWPYR